ncbi:UNVERIFIED_CONTAM: hypothetical protein Sangu_1567700 [Sesamum angustifolium]|uniref:RNase H type-1 domain-containing protein n=1 Tax=Sesamum angustifolium TaxID=2727405 RepID=A0AAW2MSF9_9LAMI
MTSPTTQEDKGKKKDIDLDFLWMQPYSYGALLAVFYPISLGFPHSNADTLIDPLVYMDAVDAAKYRGISFSMDDIILEVQRHLHTLSSSPNIVRWRAPSSSWFKLNTDDSSFGNPGLAEATGIIGDLAGHVHLPYQVALGTWTSKLTAIWRGLELAFTHGLAPLVVEVHATAVISLLQSCISG